MRAAGQAALVRAGLVLALLVAPLAGCTGDDAGDGAQPSLSSTPSTPSTRPALPSASISTTILPESALVKVSTYTYTEIPGSGGVVPPEIGQLTSYFDGYIGRLVNRGGKPVGTLQLLRTKKGVLGDEASGEKVLEEFLKGFSRATSFERRTVAGHTILSAPVPSSTATVAGWRDGRDLVLLYAAPSLSPTGFARAYLTA